MVEAPTASVVAAQVTAPAVASVTCTVASGTLPSLVTSNVKAMVSPASATDPDDGAVTSPPDSTSTPLDQIGAIHIDKTVDRATAAHGDTLTYEVSVENLGTLSVTDLVASDQLPAGVTFVSATGGGTLSGSAVTWTIPSLESGGSAEFTVVVTIDPGTAAATLTNRFSVANPGGFDPVIAVHACADDLEASCATTEVDETVVIPSTTIAPTTTAPTTTTTAPRRSGVLPRTGSSPAGLVLLGSSLALLGVFIWGAGRRRRVQPGA